MRRTWIAPRAAVSIAPRAAVSIAPRAAVSIAAFGLAACAVEPLPPPGQLLLFVDTDAVVPGEARAPRFDRVEIAVFAPGATTPCDGCTRAFAVDTQAFRDRRVSVGIPTTATTQGFRARVRLYWAGEAGVPRPTYTIERTIALPPRGENEVREVWVYLPTEGVARPEGTLATPRAPDERTAESQVGTFRLAGPIPCGIHPNEPSAVCVPGGTFWMDRSESLTAVSPFWIDATEVTVRSARAQGARFLEPPASEVTAPSTNYCTAKAKDDLLPANCIRTTQATAVCEARGGRLPTEAEWEYLASQLGASRFPWGNDAPTCEDAVVGRGEGVEPIGAVFCTRLDASKYPPGPTRVAGPGAPHGRDVVHLPGGDVFDLGGNMGELVADDAALVGGPCWAPGGLRIDPRCVDPARSELSNARGGSYFFPRFAGSPFPGRTPSSFERGFRCAYPAR